MIKNILLEFKKFAMRGNVIDMAVGIIIGGAFGKIVDSLVKDIMMPPLGLLLGKVDFAGLYFVIKPGAGGSWHYDSLAAAQAAGAITMNIGNFLNTIISFIIMAFAIFMLIKGINSLEAKKTAAPVTTKACPYCFTTIDLRATKCPNCTAELKE